MNYVYWIRNQECTDIRLHGYVGVSKDPSRRFLSHRRHNEKIPSDAWLEIVFSGTREECFEKEYQLRQHKNIGWNRAVGGVQGFRVGFSHSEKTKKKLRKSWTTNRKKAASEWKASHNVSLTGQKRPAQSAKMTGACNPMFGKTHSDVSREKIRRANIGKTPSNKQSVFCIFCQTQAPLSVLVKYHGRGKKNCSKLTD